MKNIMKLFLYAALPLALIALGSCSYPKNITFKADSQTGALSGLYLTSVYLANLHTSFLCNLIYPTFSRILLYSC